MVWLGSAIAAVLAIAANELIPPLLAPNLRVMLDVPYVVSIPEREIIKGVERQLISATFCVKNHGIRSGRLHRIEVGRGGTLRLPQMEVIRFDHDAIGWREARPIEVVFLLTAPFTNEELTPMHGRLELYDENDRYIGDVNLAAKFQPSPPGKKVSAPHTVTRSIPPEMCETST